MDESVIFRLRDAVTIAGPDLLSDNRRAAALVRDTVLGARREANALVAAAEDGVPASLVAGATPAFLEERLASERGLSPEVAAWAVRGWIIAVGLKPEELPSAPTDVDEAIWPRARTWIGMAGVSALVMLLVSFAWDVGFLSGPNQVHITRVATGLTSLAALAAIAGLVRKPRWSAELAGFVAGMGLGVAAPVMGAAIALLLGPGVPFWAVFVLIAATVAMSVAGIGMARADRSEGRPVESGVGGRVVVVLVAVAMVFALLDAVTFLSQGGTPELGIPSLAFAALLGTLLLVFPRRLGTRVTAGAMAGAGAAAVAEGLGVATLPAVLELNPLFSIPVVLQSTIGVGVLPMIAGYFMWLHGDPRKGEVAEDRAVDRRTQRAPM